MRCPDYDDPSKIIDETAEEYLCEYCGMRGNECDGKGNIRMRCPDYDDPSKIIDETAEEYLCEYCGMRGNECDGKGNISLQPKINNDM
ncbi:hypothetical protein K9N50_11385 [bacterium]|nr:hypothetical protein [bacterium]